MLPHDLAEKIEALIIAANDKFVKAMAGVEAKLYNDLLAILRLVGLDPDGYIKQSAENRAILRTAQAQFDKSLENSVYQYSVEKHLSAINEIDALNQAYFETVSSTFKANKIFIRGLQNSAVETVNSYLLQDGLASQVKLPLNNILNQNFNTGGSFSGMLNQLRIFIKGDPDLDGRLVSYSRGILRDALFQYSRAYQQSVTADLKLSWYSYSGGVMDKTRPFCIERNGKFFHQKEVEAWAELDWAGKNNQTTKSSIFVLCGGWNCGHSIIPVSEIIVPKSDLDRIETPV